MTPRPSAQRQSDDGAERVWQAEATVQVASLVVDAAQVGAEVALETLGMAAEVVGEAVGHAVSAVVDGISSLG